MLSIESQRCRTWAKKTRGVTRVYFFGSRVRGDHRPDSDLDIFVVTDAGLAILMKRQWEEELKTLLDIKVHLVLFDSANRKLLSNVKAESLLVYSRYNGNLDFAFEDVDEVDLTEM